MSETPIQSASHSVATGPAQASLEKEARWAHASAQEQAVLRRIAQQRDRLAARKAAKQQARALQAQAQSIPVDAPLAERVLAFARLHPFASVGLVGAALWVGPRKLMRVGMAVLPLISKLRR
ncbi:MAG: hypothetical protein LBE51_02905 [Acidovorax sp.]|nr:hypothetical protein [Acidovorax sp.]